MLRKLILMLLAMALISPLSAMAEVKVVKLGDITSFTGEVLVRSKGEWRQLTKAPFPIHSSDKVVTKRGRAEAQFVGGGILRMDVDSSLSIAQKKETEGLIFRKTVTIRQINVLVGDIYFDVKVERGSPYRYAVRSPSMTASVRGSGLRLMVDGQGQSKYQTLSGDIDTVGSFSKHPQPVPMTREQVEAPQSSLPSKTDRFGNKHIGNADKAVQAQQKAGTGGTGRDNAQAKLLGANELLGEAETFNENVDAARASVSQIQESIEKVSELTDKIAGYEEKLAAATTDAEKAVYQAAIETAQSAAAAETAVITAQVAVSAALQSGDSAAVQQASQSLQKAEDAAQSASDQVENIDTLATSLSVATTDAAVNAIVQTAKAVSNAAALNAQVATSYAEVAVQSAAQDASGAQAAQTQATQAETVASTVNTQVNTAVNAVQTGNYAQATTVSQAINEATSTVTTAPPTEGPGGTDEPPPPPEEPPTEEPPPTPEIIDTSDLPTSTETK